MRLSGRKSSSFTRRWTQRPRVVLLALISINAGAFVAQLILETLQPGIVREFFALSDHGLRAAYSWQFFTAIFLHNGPWHFLANTFVLYVLGRDVEAIIGQRHFLFLYLAGAMSGELSHLFLMPASTVLFGASGGVAAILMAYATMLPEMELTSLLFFFPRTQLKAKHLRYAALVIAPLVLLIDRGAVAVQSTYLGGIVAGWLYAHLLGFGRPSLMQRTLRNRDMKLECYRSMSAEQFITEEVDPVLEKISRDGLQSLTRNERGILTRAQEKIAEKTRAI